MILVYNISAIRGQVSDGTELIYAAGSKELLKHALHVHIYITISHRTCVPPLNT